MEFVAKPAIHLDGDVRVAEYYILVGKAASTSASIWVPG